MKATVRVHEAANLRGLATAMLMQATRDLRNKRKPLRQIDALLWLTGDDFPVWCDAMSAPFMDPFKMLSIGGARKLRERRVKA